MRKGPRRCGRRGSELSWCVRQPGRPDHRDGLAAAGQAARGGAVERGSELAALGGVASVNCEQLLKVLAGEREGHPKVREQEPPNQTADPGAIQPDSAPPRER